MLLKPVFLNAPLNDTFRHQHSGVEWVGRERRGKGELAQELKHPPPTPWSSIWDIHLLGSHSATVKAAGPLRDQHRCFFFVCSPAAMGLCERRFFPPRECGQETPRPCPEFPASFFFLSLGQQVPCGGRAPFTSGVGCSGSAISAVPQKRGRRGGERIATVPLTGQSAFFRNISLKMIHTGESVWIVRRIASRGPKEGFTSPSAMPFEKEPICR